MLAIIAICSAQAALESVKLEEGTTEKLQENVVALMRQVGEMGVLLENYRRSILSGLTEATDLCEFIDKLSDLDNDDDKNPDGNLRFQLTPSSINHLTSAERLTADAMGIRLYKGFFQKLNDPILKSQLFSSLENHIDNCFAVSPQRLVAKRDKSQVQKIRFHSWGGKRNRGGPKVVIRTPFHSWGGKRSDKV